MVERAKNVCLARRVRQRDFVDDVEGRTDRECPCVSATSYATTDYRRLASRPRPLALTPLPFLPRSFLFLNLK
jgi:hypothetical protein